MCLYYIRVGKIILLPYIYIYIYIHTHTHTHTHTHIYIYMIAELALLFEF
jgi:hypothetical protein